MFRSVRSIVIAPAKTGSDNKRRIAVMITAQGNSGVLSRSIPDGRIFIIVEMKFTAPKIDEIPAKCSLKIARSTEAPLWAILAESGGYTVQPVPAPLSLILLRRSKDKEGGRSQNLILFSRGKAISGAPIIRGTNQFPNPPIKVGITMKKIIMNAWAVTMTL